MEKIDIYDSDKNYELAIQKLSKDKKISSSNAKLILEFLDKSAIGKTASRKARVKSVGVRARLKNLYLLKIVGYYFKQKSFKELNVKDIEQLIKDIDSNKIKKLKNQNYSEQTKSNIKKTLILLLRWIHGENSKKFLDLTSWIDTRFKQKSIDYFKENEVLEVLNKCNTIRQKVLVCCLFSGGFRIEEFLNIRNSDITFVEGNVPYYRFKVRTEFSKTLGRDIPMFWRYSTDIIKEWLSSEEHNSKQEEPFYDSTYDGVRMLLHKIGERVGKKLTPHKLRRSSAFYFANSGKNEFQINKKYGWSAGSRVGGKYYIEQSSIDIEEGESKKEFENLKIEEINEKAKKQEEEINNLKEQLKTELEEVKKLLSGYVKEKKK